MARRPVRNPPSFWNPDIPAALDRGAYCTIFADGRSWPFDYPREGNAPVKLVAISASPDRYEEGSAAVLSADAPRGRR
jgi:hypothetical protein